MVSVLQSTLTIILSAEFVIGNLGNGFIALVNCVDWVKRKEISSADQILTALAISRIGLLWLVSINWYISVFCRILLLPGKTLRISSIGWTVTNHFNNWLATILSIFYFLKIANFSNSIFLYLKWRVKEVISVILLVTSVLLMFNIALINMHINVWISEHKINMTCSSRMSNFAQLSTLTLFTNTLFTFIPFAVSLVIFLLLIFSLWKHLKKMQHNAKGSRDASIEAHIKAMKSVIAFLLLFAIFFLSLFASIWNLTFN
ncbi:PREDICTED: taste receptor type 2 member 14-like [Ceratotherium simum simum]|uniref:Taste receptor type 2 member 14-like n=1 Tax=Ceratotherium simum simum TaxID=73337 RepID=A0ABM0HWP0_CERSS|nr:PREDICTED: taste receptor type 2 member 14-like [Ceratotherium simum simum]